MSTEAKAKAKEKAEVARVKKLTDKRIEDLKMASLTEDSLRMDSDRVAREIYEVERKAYVDTRLREIDSTNKESWKRLSTEKEIAAKTEYQLDAINRAANLSAYESRQVKIINQTYFDRAKAVKENEALTDAERKQQLTALNTERRAKIRAAIGTGKDKKLEKERKEFTKKFGEDQQAKWIDEVSVVKNN